MNKIMRVSFAALALCAICGLLIWSAATMYAGGQAKISTQDFQEPGFEIDQKAKAAGGANESALRELADALFRDPGLWGVIPDVVARPYKQRLIRSEISYRVGRFDGISEKSLVELIDQLASAFDAPNYARTSQEEVHDLRLIISRRMPHFIPHESLSGQSDPDLAFGFTIKPSMSPLEAMYVTRTLIGYKLEVEAYLLTPLERANVNRSLQSLRKEYQLTPLESSFVMQDLIDQALNNDKSPRPIQESVTLARKRSAELSAEVGLRQTEAVLIGGRSSPRLEAMETVRRRADALSLSAARQLVDGLLDGLGIER